MASVEGEGDLFMTVLTATDVAMHIIDRRVEDRPDSPLHLCKQTEMAIELIFATIQRLTDMIVIKREVLKRQQQECSECQLQQLADLMNNVEM